MEEKALVGTKHLVNDEMLIAVSTKKPDLSSELSDAFGRSRYFMIYDSIENTSEFMVNPFSSELGGAGIQSSQFLIEKNIEAIITTFIGLNTLRFINSLNIKVYKSSNLKTSEAIQWFTDNKLAEITCNEVEQYPERKRKRNGNRFSKYSS